MEFFMTKYSKILTILLAFAFIFSASVMADEIKIKTNPHCGMCKSKIEKGLKKVSGVDKAELNLENKLVTVNYDANLTSAEVLMKKVEELGYTAELYVADANTPAKATTSKCCSTSNASTKSKDCSTSDKCCKDGSAKTDNCCKEKK